MSHKLDGEQPRCERDSDHIPDCISVKEQREQQGQSCEPIRLDRVCGGWEERGRVEEGRSSRWNYSFQ